MSASGWPRAVAHSATSAIDVLPKDIPHSRLTTGTRALVEGEGDVELEEGAAAGVERATEDVLSVLGPVDEFLEDAQHLKVEMSRQG